VAKTTTIDVTWRTHVDGSPAHTWPVDDLVDHDVDDDAGGCICGPTVAPVECDDGSVGWLITHHSLDGREAHESDAAT
jgi:hypothetical protein